VTGPADPGATPGEPPDQDAYRKAFGQFATGIAVVAATTGGVTHAMTVSALTSVSLDPLLVLVCVDREARFHDAVLSAGTWAVSVLTEDHEKTARWLATRGRPADGQLDDHPHHPGPVTGHPILDDALASLESRTYATRRRPHHPGRPGPLGRRPRPRRRAPGPPPLPRRPLPPPPHPLAPARPGPARSKASRAPPATSTPGVPRGPGPLRVPEVTRAAAAAEGGQAQGVRCYIDPTGRGAMLHRTPG
jgi:flavin reductase (DIM6/NTAB) family NADH-FMN oxidoreductase RutF